MLMGGNSVQADDLTEYITPEPLPRQEMPTPPHKPITAQDKALAASIAQDFRMASLEHGVRIGAILNIVKKYELTNLARASGTDPERVIEDYLTNDHITFANQGFNIAVVTCPSKHPNTYLSDGISVGSINYRTGVDFENHMTMDSNTAPTVDEKGKTVIDSAREFSFIVMDGKLLPLTPELAEEAKDRTRGENYAPEDYALRVTPQTLKMLAEKHNETCSPRF